MVERAFDIDHEAKRQHLSITVSPEPGDEFAVDIFPNSDAGERFRVYAEDFCRNKGVEDCSARLGCFRVDGRFNSARLLCDNPDCPFDT